MAGLKRPLLSFLEMLVLVHLSACFAGAQRSIDALVKPPVIDKHDIRFIRLSVNREPLRSWVTNVVQDANGFLWLGTSDGLYRYDGYVLKSYRHDRGNPNSVANDSIAAVYKDRDGSLWVGSSYGGLDRLDPRHDTFTHYHHESGQPGTLANNNVNCVYRDHSGQLWACTADGLDRLEEASGTFVHYRHNPQDVGSLAGNTVNCVYEDRQGNLWVGTTSGLNRLDRVTGRFTRFLHDPANPHSIGHNYVSSILEDRSGALWVASPMGSGLSALDVKTGEFTRYSFHTEEPSSQSVAGVNRIFEDRDGALWVCSVDRGLLKLDRERKTFTRYSNRPGDPTSLPNDSVQSMLEDSEGQMWAGTVSGLSRFRRGPPSFVNYRHESYEPNSLHNGMIWSVLADSRGFLWIGDEDGLNRLNRRTGQFAFYQHVSSDHQSLSYNKVAAIREDPSGTLWLGTYGGGLERFDRTTERFFTYRHDPKDPASLSSDAILSLLIDRQGTLWVGTQGGGLDRFDKATGRFTTYLNDPINPALPLLDLYEDQAGMLWVGTAGEGLFRFDPGTKQVTSYRHNPESPLSLSSDKVNAIWEDRQGQLWIGSEDGLNLLDRNRGTAKIFTIQDGLPDNAIESIQEDGQGYLWLGTHNGLSRFDPRRKTFRNYFESDGLVSNLLNPHGARGSCRTPDGELVFGSSNGVTAFNPDRIADNPYVPPVKLTDFLLFNRPVRPGKESPITKSIWATDSITLNHKQNILTLEFAALSYMAPERNRYRYRLEGLEKQWNEVDSSRRSATYTNLASGKYTFRVQGSNNDGRWNTKGVTLAITVLPPWWATWWFDTLVALILVGVILAAYRSRVKGLRLQTARLESQVARRTRELEIARDAAEAARNAAEVARSEAEAANQSKTVFLANISHELRTPLNAILGFSSLLREESVSDKQRRDLDIINRNGEHLLTLINDVLDMSKIDAGGVVIENTDVDVNDLVKGVMDLMRLRAEEKGIELSLEQGPELCQFVQADGEKLREVLINLVGNAVKYTQRGKVTLRVGTQATQDSRYCQLMIEVQDTGIGIASEDQERIFEPFVQVGKSRTQRGTGLGLAITKKYIELMGGALRVESAPGQGSLFRVEVPALKVEKSEMPGSKVHLGQVMGLEPGQPAYRILIVEDQEENWLLLHRLLENAGFELQVAGDGETAIGKFQAWRPHFIWMDWRLPGMDGLEVARRIRVLDGSREVKIVILSAFAFSEYRDRALQAGADDFVSKPFQAEEIFDCLARHLRVGYVYETTANVEIPSVLSQESLTGLPEEVRTELTNAVISLNIERIASLIGRISEQNPALGRTLSRYAARYEFSQILEALQPSEAMRT